MDIPGLLARLPIARFQSPPPVVAVLRLAGVIGGPGFARNSMGLATLENAIERAFKLPRLEAVALSINSPGGSPTQSDLIARRIRSLAEEKGVTVLAFCEDVAASGGYWLACAGDEIFVGETSIVGSIGVISASFGFPELLQRIGIERRLHTAGDKKSMLDPFRAEEPKDVQRLKSIQKELHESFKEVVRRRRGARLKGAERTLFSGEFWTGKRALELGLVDGIGEMRQTLRARYGEKVVLKRVDGVRGWRRRLGWSGSGALFQSSHLGRSEPGDWAAGLIGAVEERALWSRFGL